MRSTDETRTGSSLSYATAYIVRGERGIGEEDVACMVAKLAKVAVAATVRDAGHDVHLEQPQQWRNVVEPFLAFT
jgi:pimeloyl-ACP methyl ester carboxylesterase